MTMQHPQTPAAIMLSNSSRKSQCIKGSLSQASASATTSDDLHHNPTGATIATGGESITHTSLDEVAEITLTQEEQEEIREVTKGSQSDTNRVVRWRFMALLALLITGLCVTITTYLLLKNEEKENFETAYERFSRTVGDAAIRQQIYLRDGLTTLATTLAVYAETNGNAEEQWPFITLPMFELHAENMRQQSNMETINFLPLVQHSERASWIEYANQKHESWVTEGHFLQTGSLDRLVGGEDTYHPYVSHRLADGSFENETELDSYFVSWQYSPPPATYDLINGNLFSVPFFASAGRAMMTLMNETVMTPVFKHVGIPTAMTKDEHKGLHSDLLDTRSENPHAFAVHPVRRVLVPDSGNPNGGIPGDIVGVLAGAAAWDVALLDLLPEGVEGILAVVQNTCNQSYTYEIRGPNAMFLGPEDLHEDKYDDMDVVVNLALHQHPDFATTEGHCQYSMHIYPSEKFKSSYDSNTPELFATVVAITFGLVAIVFFVYDLVVQRRNHNLIVKAAQTNAIVYSLFPNKHSNGAEQDDVEQPQQRRQDETA